MVINTDELTVGEVMHQVTKHCKELLEAKK